MPKNIKQNIPLAQHTTLGVGGAAEYFAEVSSIEELQECIAWAKTSAVSVTVLGGGSNVLVSDDGLAGLVLRPQFNEVVYREVNSDVLVTADAGVVLDVLISDLVDKKLWGLENLSAIPGTVGAVPIQNVGAYGVEAKDIVHEVTVYDMDTEKVSTIQNAQCVFGYRDSYFKHNEGRKLIIISVTFCVSKISSPRIEYKDLQELFKDEKFPGLIDIRDAVIHIRSKKFPNWNVIGTAGSFFKNPILEKELYETLLQTYPAMPGYETTNQKIKIPLGWVLDHICNVRGYSEGNVGLFEHQALVLVCTKNATAIEIENFSQKIIERVHALTGIVVEREVTLLK